MEDLKILKKLYQTYNPKYKNKYLVESYTKITGKKVEENNGIRKVYNDSIINGYFNEAVIKYHLTNYLMKKVPDCQIMYEVNTNISLNENSRMSRCDLVYAYEFTGLTKPIATTTGYEIKTEFDTFKRLPQQIEDYQKIFDFVVVVIPKSKESELHALRIINNLGFGIMVYDKACNFTLRLFSDESNLSDSKARINCMTNVFIRKYFRSNIRTREELKDLNKSKEDIDYIYFAYLKYKYSKNWENLKKQIKNGNIEPLDYQWFFKNKINTDLVYR